VRVAPAGRQAGRQPVGRACRRVFTRYDKTAVMFAAFITAAFIAEALRCVDGP
jgi:hypothetical protein